MRLIALAISLFFVSVGGYCQNRKVGKASCGDIENAVLDGNYREALKMMIITGESACSRELRAKVLKFNGRYREALELLTETDSEEAKRLRTELNRLLGLGDTDIAYAVYPFQGSDTSATELIFFVEDQPVSLSLKNNEPDEFPYRSDGSLTYIPDTSLSLRGDRAKTFMQSILSRLKANKVQLGPATYGEEDMFYYTARYYTPILSRGRSDNISIYSLDGSGKNDVPYWINPDYSYAHPSMDEDGWLYFSSDRPGGYGGMDLWKINTKNPNSEPINLGEDVNSSHAEVFPAPIGDSLYFVTNDPLRVIGGYDVLLYHDGSTVNPGEPLNGAFDDFNPYALGSDLKYMISNRGPSGNDDIYVVYPFKSREMFDVLNGRVEASVLNAGQKVELLNSEGQVVDYTFIDGGGSFTFAHVKGAENYTVAFPETDLEAGDRLFLFDGDYKPLEEITSNGSNQFMFTLLTPEDYTLVKEVNEDESMLSVDITGILSRGENANPAGVEIILQDAAGNTIGRSFTNAGGSFSFQQVKPDDTYKIKSNVVDPESEINIFNDAGELIETIKPDPDGEFVYVRLKESDRIITITNEKYMVIKVEEDEKFNLRAIYFDSNTAELKPSSLTILDQLIYLLEENAHVSINLAGHTDARGGFEHNMQLSQWRIETVRNYLIDKGISPRRITGKGFGESQPVNRCTDGVECSDEEHAENRRTEIRFYNTDKP